MLSTPALWAFAVAVGKKRRCQRFFLVVIPKFRCTCLGVPIKKNIFFGVHLVREMAIYLCIRAFHRARRR